MVHLGINESNYFLYNSWGLRAYPPPLLLKLFQLIHLNQAGVQHFICDLTNTHSSTFRHSHKGALKVRAGLIDTYMGT